MVGYRFLGAFFVGIVFGAFSRLWLGSGFWGLSAGNVCFCSCISVFCLNLWRWGSTLQRGLAAWCPSVLGVPIPLALHFSAWHRIRRYVWWPLHSPYWGADHSSKKNVRFSSFLSWTRLEVTFPFTLSQVSDHQATSPPRIYIIDRVKFCYFNVDMRITFTSE